MISISVIASLIAFAAAPRFHGLNDAADDVDAKTGAAASLNDTTRLYFHQGRYQHLPQRHEGKPLMLRPPLFARHQ